MADRYIRQKMKIVGDYEVLKVHFLLQIIGKYEKDIVYFPTKIENYVKDVDVYDKTVELSLWDTSEFVANVNSCKLCWQAVKRNIIDYVRFLTRIPILF